MVKALADVLVFARRLHRDWSRTESRFDSWGWADETLDDRFWEEPEIAEGDSVESIRLARRAAIQEMPRERRMYAQEYEKLYWSVRDWRNAIDHAVEVLPRVEKYADDPKDPPIKRWTTCVRRELRVLAGFIHRDTRGDLPLLGEGVPSEFAECIEEIRNRLEELKAIESTDLLEAEASPPVADSVEDLNGSARADTSDSKPSKDGLDSEKAAAETSQPTASSPSENDKPLGRKPRRSPQNETKPVFPIEAAKIFGMERRTFLAAIDRGSYAARWISDKKLCLDLDEVDRANPEAAKRLDPTSPVD